MSISCIMHVHMYVLFYKVKYLNNTYILMSIIRKIDVKMNVKMYVFSRFFFTVFGYTKINV